MKTDYKVSAQLVGGERFRLVEYAPQRWLRLEKLITVGPAADIELRVGADRVPVTEGALLADDTRLVPPGCLITLDVTNGSDQQARISVALIFKVPR